jgi:hypothetical protein
MECALTGGQVEDVPFDSGLHNEHSTFGEVVG